ncbi:MAG TPA: glycosyltransferase family 4 protein [Solirubrobacteraceae bacterium]|jgi:glycosyltransferase involved in cell wall biosynthesis
MGSGPSHRESGGAPGVAAELLLGLASRGHRIDCFLPGTGYEPPPRIAAEPNIRFFWGTHEGRWDRWYARVRVAQFVGGLWGRAFGSIRLRRAVLAQHERDPYDIAFQFNNIETLAMPRRLRDELPLVIQPGTHSAGELRYMLKEWRLALRCMPFYTLGLMTAVMGVRVLVQRTMVRRARLVICISSVFRDHVVHDYALPADRTVVIPNPVRVERFADAEMSRAVGDPPRVLVLGRVVARKGIEDVVAVAALLRERGASAHIRIVGGPSLWSDYTKLLAALPTENAEYVGRIPPSEVPDQLASADLLLQASSYEPFGLTVVEALASGVPVVATTEVGAVEGVDPELARLTGPGEVARMADAIEASLAALADQPEGVRTRARAEAARLFASEPVCERVSRALEELVHERRATGGGHLTG